MGYPHGVEPFTLAQFARRAGISESRARALYAAKPSGLPKSDRSDAGGRPLWFAGTIDAWCARTGRAVPDDSLWLFRAPAATSPAVELQRGIVPTRGRGARDMFVIVWDTDHGHVIYLQPLGDTGGDHKDWMADAAAELIEPRWWSTAVVVMPIEESLSSYVGTDPIGYIYRLVTDNADNRDTPDSPMDGVRRWFRRAGTDNPSASAKAVWVTHLDLGEVARVVGRPIPAWLYDTTTTENARQSLAYNQTFTISDTETEWHQTQTLLEQAVQVDLPRHYPAGFAALAADAGKDLRSTRDAHEKTPDTGDGWYLVCRPARPAPPLELEQLITTARPVEDLELVANDLTELRQLERDLTVTDPRGDAYEKTVALLAWQLQQAERNSGEHRYTAIADDDLVIHSAAWEGPVVDTWRRQLTPTDLRDALTLRRVQRLVANGYENRVREAYRDLDGRYVLVVALDNGEVCSRAEWPVGLQVTATWTDKTVLAADDHRSVVTLLALTPEDSGRLRVDPVPMMPRGHREAFAFGYGGGTPATTYGSILRCALGYGDNLDAIQHAAIHPDEHGSSELWKAISTTTGPPRLSWPQIQLWARADRKATKTSQ